MKTKVTPVMITQIVMFTKAATLLLNLSTIEPIKKHPSTSPTPKATIASVDRYYYYF